MNLATRFSVALVATAIMCLPSFADITVVDFGAIQDNCCGDNAHTPLSPVEVSDPLAVTFLHPNAATAPSDSTVLNLTDGATLSWTNVSAWNNNPGPGVTAADNFFLNRQSDPLDTFFTVTTANPADQVTIEFVAGPDRDANITIDGTTTLIPSIADAGIVAWTSVGTFTGTTTGELTEANDDEGNVGAARITIIPATIPEPTSFALLGLGAATAVLRRRRS